MQIPIYQVDAFTKERFRGNPAAVCPLKAWLPDETLQAIAAENCLSETAFFIPTGDGYHLRWFTPTDEVDLCGHATLATAHVLFECLSHADSPITFHTRSGELTVVREEGRLAMDFPAHPPSPVTPPPGLADALGAHPEDVLASSYLMAVFPEEKDIRDLKPDMTSLGREIDAYAVITTAPGTDCDFVSRFFAPRVGVAEDPVTGSAHCVLTPYWSKRLGKTRLHARQISKRGGDLTCEFQGDRVRIAGHAVLYLEGSITA